VFGKVIESCEAGNQCGQQRYESELRNEEKSLRSDVKELRVELKKLK
jgi:hypothetical protein